MFVAVLESSTFDITRDFIVGVSLETLREKCAERARECDDLITAGDLKFEPDYFLEESYGLIFRYYEVVLGSLVVIPTLAGCYTVSDGSTSGINSLMCSLFNLCPSEITFEEEGVFLNENRSAGVVAVLDGKCISGRVLLYLFDKQTLEEKCL